MTTVKVKVVKDINTIFNELREKVQPYFIDKEVDSKLILDLECKIIEHLKENGLEFPFKHNGKFIYAINVLPNPIRVIFLEQPVMKKKKKELVNVRTF